MWWIFSLCGRGLAWGRERKRCGFWCLQPWCGLFGENTTREPLRELKNLSLIWRPVLFLWFSNGIDPQLNQFLDFFIYYFLVVFFFFPFCFFCAPSALFNIGKCVKSVLKICEKVKKRIDFSKSALKLVKSVLYSRNILSFTYALGAIVSKTIYIK